MPVLTGVIFISHFNDITPELPRKGQEKRIAGRLLFNVSIA